MVGYMHVVDGRNVERLVGRKHSVSSKILYRDSTPYREVISFLHVLFSGSGGGMKEDA